MRFFKPKNCFFANLLHVFCLCFVKVMLISVNRLNIKIVPLQWRNLPSFLLTESPRWLEAYNVVVNNNLPDIIVPYYY